MCCRVPTARLYLGGSLYRHDHFRSLRSLLWSYLPTDICCLRQLFIIPYIEGKLYIVAFSEGSHLIQKFEQFCNENQFSYAEDQSTRVSSTGYKETIIYKLTRMMVGASTDCNIFLYYIEDTMIKRVRIPQL